MHAPNPLHPQEHLTFPKELTHKLQFRIPIRKVPAHNNRILGTANNPSSVKLQLKHSRVIAASLPAGIVSAGVVMMVRMMVVMMRSAVGGIGLLLACLYGIYDGEMLLYSGCLSVVCDLLVQGLSAGCGRRGQGRG